MTTSTRRPELAEGRRDPLAARDAQPVALASEGAPIALKYDYDSLPAEHRDAIREAATDIKRRERRAAMDIVEIGRALKGVQARLEHGEFLPWLDTEFGWQQRMAYNFMAVADKFAKFANLEQFGLSALYLLSGPSVPESAIDEANAIAAKGERVTHKAAKSLIDAAKPAPPAPRTLTADEARAVILRVVNKAEPRPAQRCDWLAKHAMLSHYTHAMTGAVVIDNRNFQAAHAAAMLELSEAYADATLAAMPAGALGDDDEAPPALPADLAAAGWDLRTMKRTNAAPGWWLHNRDRNLATSVYDTQAAAIAEAHAKQSGAAVQAPASEAQKKQFRLQGEIAFWRDALRHLDAIGELTGRHTLSLGLGRGIEGIISVLKENVTQ